ncbi:MAG: Fic family protein [Beijerinckiaceae bacterium]
MTDRNLGDFDFGEAVGYHYDKFPPNNIDYSKLIKALSGAAAALARYDQMLKSMHNGAILLAPLRSQEAVVSSRMEGTISTLDEVLRYEAENEDNAEEPNASGKSYRSDTIEVALYSRAMLFAQRSLKDGQPISSWLMRTAHRMLLSFGQGAEMAPGEFKKEQNYLADKPKRKILFVPISPERLVDGIEQLMAYIGDDRHELLIRAAVSHLEFEALHPFKDGNGRIGRMLIPLMLWKYGALTEPYFYMSAYFEQKKNEYIDKMRDVSSQEAWTPWILFFLEALEAQALANLKKAEEIRNLYESMKKPFREHLTSQWSTAALDFVFTTPVFRNNAFTKRSGIPAGTAHRFVRSLVNANLLKTISPASGRRPALYAFEPLIVLLRE